jgi:hypothetical protein
MINTTERKCRLRNKIKRNLRDLQSIGTSKFNYYNNNQCNKWKWWGNPTWLRPLTSEITLRILLLKVTNPVPSCWIYARPKPFWPSKKSKFGLFLIFVVLAIRKQNVSWFWWNNWRSEDKETSFNNVLRR